MKRVALNPRSFCPCGRAPTPTPPPHAGEGEEDGDGDHAGATSVVAAALALEKARAIIFTFIFVFHVKRSHVKRFVKVNETNSLTYTKFAEDHVQDILDVDPAEQPAERPSRHPQLLRRQFLPFLNRRQTAL